MMRPGIMEQYIEKIYGYAVRHTFSRDEADELSQEIMLTAIRELPGLRDESKFEPWLWGVASNTTKSFRRYMGKQRAMYSYDVFESGSYVDDADENTEELYDFLRSKIAMLSELYRDIIILYYYDGLSTKEISEKLNVPEGTVTWRLTEARRKIKKEVRDMDETALRPVQMKIDIYGNGDYDGIRRPFPSVYIDDALSQNILYHCYEQPGRVEDLAKLCGVPAYYVEDRIRNLLEREAVVETSKGRYQTDFVIWSDKYGIYGEEHAEKALLPIMDDLVEAVKIISRRAMEIDFYKAEKSEDDLLYLFGALAFQHVCEKDGRLPYPRVKKKYDGNEWCYIGYMESGKHKRIGVSTWRCSNQESRGRYSHTAFGSISGISFRQMMYDNYINVCEDILCGGSSEDLESVANAIKDGYIVRRKDGSLFVTTPAFTIEQKERFDKIAEEHLSPLMPRYSEAVNQFIAGYKKLFPRHLREDADRMCQNLFVGMYAVIIDYAQRTDKIRMPSPGCYCDVMQQFK